MSPRIPLGCHHLWQLQHAGINDTLKSRCDMLGVLQELGTLNASQGLEVQLLSPRMTLQAHTLAVLDVAVRVHKALR